MPAAAATRASEFADSISFPPMETTSPGPFRSVDGSMRTTEIATPNPGGSASTAVAGLTR
ncbi:MAG: hypothetical protein BWY66_00081 [bacterium ADurb.Bin374]|nr:MAG: hypothetical protein BWY66_00081 [bacterium ADurb.Bin374]